MRANPTIRRRARARSAVTWCVIAFLLSQLSLAVVLERWRPELRDPEYGHKLNLLRRQIARTPHRPLLVALGSSRTLNGLRPERLDPSGPLVFNFGLTRHGPVQQMLALDRLLRDGIRPDAVTIEVLPLALAQGAQELDPTPAFRHTWGDVRYLHAHGYRPAAYALDWLEARALPCYANRFALMSRIEANWVPWAERQDFIWSHIDECGWLEAPAPRSEAEAQSNRERTMRDDGPQMRRFRIAPDSDRALRLTLDRCRDEQIAAAIVLMPEATWFRAFYAGNGDRQLRDYSAGLGRDFGVPLIDARAWCADGDFRDGHHLLAEGVQRFTARFRCEVFNSLLQIDGK